MSRQAGATTLERMAKVLSDYRLPKTISCWYCDARLIEDGARLSLQSTRLETNTMLHGQEGAYLDATPMKKGPAVQAWLDEELGNLRKGSAAFQGVCREQVLRSTACFNACDFGLSSPGICRQTFGIPAWSGGLKRP